MPVIEICVTLLLLRRSQRQRSAAVGLLKASERFDVEWFNRGKTSLMLTVMSGLITSGVGFGQAASAASFAALCAKLQDTAIRRRTALLRF